MASFKCSGWKHDWLSSNQIWTNMPKLNQKKKGKVLMVASAVGFREKVVEEVAILVVQNHLSFKSWEIIPLRFSHSEVSQLCLEWEEIPLAGNGQELRLHTANCKAGKGCCASHPGASSAEQSTTWLPSKAANQRCSGKKRPFKEFSKL